MNKFTNIMTFPVEVFGKNNGVLTARFSDLERIIDLNDVHFNKPKPYVLAEISPKRFGFRISGKTFPTMFEITEVTYDNDELVAWTLSPTKEEIAKKPKLQKMTCLVFNE